MKRLHLALLGPFRACLGDGTTLRVRRRKARALLAYLALRPSAPQPRETLVALLWPEVDPAEARHSLRQTLTVLRHDLAPLRWPAALLAGEALGLPAERVSVDVSEFERLGRSAAPEHLEQAVAAYRGEFLDGLMTGEEAFDAWLAGERERLRAVAVHALDALLAIHLASRAAARGVGVATRLLALDPLREDVHRVLMRLHARDGRRAAALRQYQTCAELLRRDLDVPPEDTTVDLYREILAQGTSIVGLAGDPARRHCLAADGAVMRSEFREAVECLELALAALGDRPAGRRELARAVDVRLGFERALVPLGESDRLDAHLDEAEAGARALGDRRRLGWVEVQRMSRDFLEGRARAAVAGGGRALEIAAETEDDTLARAARYRLAQAHYWAGDFPRGVRMAAELADDRRGELWLGDSVQGVLPGVHCRGYLALSLTSLGDFARGRDAALEAVRLAERAGHEWSVAFARSALGVCDLQRGRPREACDSFAVARQLQCPSGGAPRFVLPGDVIGSAYALIGRREEGRQLVEASTRAAAPRGLGPSRQRGLASLARWHLREGRLAEARAHAEAALRLARVSGQRAGEASALHLLAQILGRAEPLRLRGRPPHAAVLCLDALARAEALGMRPLAAHCHSTLSDLWERAGDLDRARHARAAAAALRRELGLGAEAPPSAATSASR